MTANDDVFTTALKSIDGTVKLFENLLFQNSFKEKVVAFTALSHGISNNNERACIRRMP